MPIVDPELRRTWLFGPGADAQAHDAMQHSDADALIVDPYFTPPVRLVAAYSRRGAPRTRGEVRRGLADLLHRWRVAGRIAVVRINALGLRVEVPT
ncbi:MAG TPA: hypothetical protein VF814_07710 [Casimicrobiaceae bacterium]